MKPVLDSILVTNDDGVDALGLWALVRAVRELAERVTVVAPTTNQSAIGAGITLHEELHWSPVESPPEGGVETWHVDGTPGDCVTVAFDRILKERPQLVVSGINHGSNIGHEVLQSGTVAGALYGYLHDVPSIAVSQFVRRDQLVDWDVAERLARWALEALVSAMREDTMLLGINLPHVALDQIRGLLVTRTGQHGYGTLNAVSDRAAILERDAGVHTDPDAPPGTDLWALAHGYLSVTPLQAMLTDYRQIERLAPALNRAFERVPDRPPLPDA